jgi:hypothetical protein
MSEERLVLAELLEMPAREIFLRSVAVAAGRGGAIR